MANVFFLCTWTFSVINKGILYSTETHCVSANVATSSAHPNATGANSRAGMVAMVVQCPTDVIPRPTLSCVDILSVSQHRPSGTHYHLTLDSAALLLQTTSRHIYLLKTSYFKTSTNTSVSQDLMAICKCFYYYLLLLRRNIMDQLTCLHHLVNTV